VIQAKFSQTFEGRINSISITGLLTAYYKLAVICTILKITSYTIITSVSITIAIGNKFSI